MPSTQFNPMLALVAIVTCFAVFATAEGLSCGSCGDECLDACGTRFFRTCCFNYLRKRSSPPVQPPVQFDENGIWMNKAELEQIIHNDIMHQPSQFNAKPLKKNEYQKPPSAAAAASNPNPLGSNNHDQLNVIYDI